MDYFLKANKSILSFSLLTLILVPLFGINFFISFLANILLLLFLIPLFLVLIAFLGFNFYKSKINKCNNCGAISLGFNKTCINCGADLDDEIKTNQFDKKPSESTIEVKAVEIE